MTLTSRSLPELVLDLGCPSLKQKVKYRGRTARKWFFAPRLAKHRDKSRLDFRDAADDTDDIGPGVAIVDWPCFW